MLDGALERERAEYEKLAWQTAHLLNVAGKTLKKNVKPSDLLKKRSATPTRERSPDRIAADASEIVRRAEG